MIISIGIHIQDHVLTIVEVLQEGTQTKLGDMSHFALDPQLSEAQKRALIIDRLNEQVEKHRKSSHRFCFSLPQSQVSSFQAVFPFKEKFKILKTIPFEIEDKSPFKSNEISFDIRASMNSAENESDIMCLLTPKTNVTHFLDFIQNTKLSPYLLTTEGVAIANLIEGWSPELKFKKQTNRHETLYIHLGYKESFVLYFYNKKLKRISSLSWGFESIVNNMMTRYHLNIEAAQKEFLNKAFILSEVEGVTKEQKIFSSLIKKEISSLVGKLKLLKLSLETDKEHQIREAYILGSGSVIQNLSSFLSNELSLPVKRMTKTAQSPSWDLFDPSSHSFLPAIGIALEGLKRPPYQGLNLIGSLKKNIGFFLQEKSKQALSYVAVLFIIFISYAVLRDQQNQKISDKVNNLFTDYSKKIAFFPIRKATVENVKKFLSTQDSIKENRDLAKGELSQPQPIDHLKTLTQNINKTSEWNLKIVFIEIKDRNIEISGYLNKDFMEDLRGQLKNISAKNKLQILQSKIDKITKNLESANQKIKTSIQKGEEQKNLQGELQKAKVFAYSFILKDNL